jgi:hypothetical protein
MRRFKIQLSALVILRRVLRAEGPMQLSRTPMLVARAQVRTPYDPARAT